MDELTETERGDKPSFLAHLIKKEAAVRQIGDKTGKNVNSALKEVRRQITQASKGNPISGEGVTKSE